MVVAVAGKGWQVGRGVISRRREGEMMLAGELLVLVVGEIR